MAKNITISIINGKFCLYGSLANTSMYPTFCTTDSKLKEVTLIKNYYSQMQLLRNINTNMQQWNQYYVNMMKNTKSK